MRFDENYLMQALKETDEMMALTIDDEDGDVIVSEQFTTRMQLLKTKAHLIRSAVLYTTHERLHD